MKAEFEKIFDKAFTKLRNEIEQYASDETFWAVSEGISNSAGTLSLHLLGNLNHYIGAKMGNSGYVRDRPVEFNSRNLPRAEILQKIDQTAATVIQTIGGLTEQDMDREYQGDEGSEPTVVSAELVNILVHFHYHLGQINYHRRIVSQSR